MSYYDKSQQQGYDATDKELNDEIEEMMRHVPPKQQRKLLNRVHDGILQRMKEESTRKCLDFIKKYEQCVNNASMTGARSCYPHRDALNDCVREVNSEEIYQRYRLAFLRGELLQMHTDKQEGRIEALKSLDPAILPEFRPDYAPKYAYQMAESGREPSGNISHDDMRGKKPL
jgi:COX assembly protein 1